MSDDASGQRPADRRWLWISLTVLLIAGVWWGFFSGERIEVQVVRVERRFTDPLFKKTVRRSKKYHAHDEANAAKIGDIVRIQECAPISKNKRWTLIAEQAS